MKKVCEYPYQLPFRKEKDLTNPNDVRSFSFYSISKYLFNEMLKLNIRNCRYNH